MAEAAHSEKNQRIRSTSYLLLSAVPGRVMLEGMANALAQTKSSPRWLRFSMRTMLVVVSMICVALAVWVAPVERQRRAVAAIEALDERATYVENKRAIVSPFWRWLPQAYQNEVAEVSLTGTKVTDAELAHLGALTGLQKIRLYDTRLTDAGLVHLKCLTKLKKLELSHNQVTDVGVAHLREMIGLQRLGLSGTQVTDAGLAQLQGLTGLQWLTLDQTQITDAGMSCLQRLTKLEVLSLRNTHVTGAGLAQLRETLPNCHIYGP